MGCWGDSGFDDLHRPTSGPTGQGVRRRTRLRPGLRRPAARSRPAGPEAVNAAEPLVTGTEVARGIARFVVPQIPILIHSPNAAGGRRMATTSTAGGFEVARIPMAELTQDRLLARLETGRDVQRRLAPERTAARAPSPSGAADAETAPRASSRPHRLVPARSVSHPRQRWITALLPASSRPDRGSPDEAPRPPAPGVRNRSGRACRSGRDSARNGRGRYRSP